MLAVAVHANLSHTTPANPHLLVGGGSLVVLDEAELLLQSAECGQRRRRSKLLHFYPTLHWAWVVAAAALAVAQSIKASIVAFLRLPLTSHNGRHGYPSSARDREQHLKSSPPLPSTIPFLLASVF